jgi:hypothetical protein
MCGATWDVRFGSKADIRAAECHVRFTPESGHSTPVDESVPFIKSVAAPVGTAFGTERTESGTANMCEPT